MLLPDLRFKLIFNFTDDKNIAPHYEKLSVFETLDLPTLRALAAQHINPSHTLSDVFKRALCRQGSIWQKES